MALNRKVCIAPMMGWTDRHERRFLRFLTRRAMLYTEMVSTGAILFGKRERFLDFHPAERPLGLQLGGNDPGEMARCARLGEEWGYDEINMNVGCPSERGQARRFGACLMREPEVVAECVQAMAEAVRVPVTVKTRIGVDDTEDYDPLSRFVARVAEAGCGTFIVHARKAWLEGLSPKENREVPPLRYDLVHRLKRDFPHLEVVLNGGLRDWDAAAAHLEHVDGVMVGREAYQNPYWLATLDRDFFGEGGTPPTRREVMEAYIAYAREEVARGVPVEALARHIAGLYQGRPRARAWRRHLAERSQHAGAGVEILEEALEIAEHGRPSGADPSGDRPAEPADRCAPPARRQREETMPCSGR